MSEKFPAELGAVYESGFSGNDVDAEKLASELDLEQYQFPNEQYQNTNKVILTLINDILPHLKGLNKEKIGDYLVEHIDDIFRICDVFPESHRLPLLITKQSLTLYEPLFTAELQMGIEEFYHALFCCIHFYLYLRGVKGISSLYSRHKQFHSHVHNIIQDECSSELMATWGGRSKYFFRKMVSDEKSSQLLKELLVGSSYRIEKSLVPEYRKLKINYWFQENLPPERILIDLPEFLGRALSPLEQEKITQLDIPALNFFLCQTHILGYEEVVGGVLKKPDYYPVWSAWVDKYIQYIKKEGSQSNTVFCGIFGIKKKKIFQPERGKLTKEAGEKIPPVIQLALLEAEQNLRKKNNAVEQIKTKVSHIYTMSSVLSVRKEKEKIDIPSTNSLFIRGGEKEQLHSLDLSGVEFPEGTTFQFERQLPKNKTFESLEITAGEQNIIPPVFGQDIKGHFIYRFTIQLPSGYTFPDGKTRTVLEEKIYAEADPTPEEQAENERRKKAKTAPINTPSSIPGVVVPTVQASVASVLEVANSSKQKTIDDTITAWELSIEENSFSVELQEDGVVIFQLNNEFINELHESQFATLRVDVLGVITPDIGSEEIQTRMIALASELRQKEEAEKLRQIETQREEKVRIKETGEKIELDSLILAHQRIFLIANETEERISALKRNNIGDLRSIAQDFTSELAKIGWSVTVGAFSAILKKNNEGMISVMEGHFNIYQPAGIEMSGAQRRLRYMIGENFQSLIQILYLGKTGKKWTLISQMRDRRNDIVVYREALQKGKGRLIVLPPAYHSKIQSGFPTGGYPLIIENVSPASIDSRIVELKEAHPECEVECCITKDAVTINGAISAMEASAILNSPRALYILKKRILLTYGFIQDPKDVNRSAIDYPKIPPTNGTESARSILQKLVKPYGDNLRQEDINDEFLRSYVYGLQDVGIKIGYNLPVTMTRETLEQGIEKKTIAD